MRGGWAGRHTWPPAEGMAFYGSLEPSRTSSLQVGFAVATRGRSDPCWADGSVGAMDGKALKNQLLGEGRHFSTSIGCVFCATGARTGPERCGHAICMVSVLEEPAVRSGRQRIQNVV